MGSTRYSIFPPTELAFQQGSFISGGPELTPATANREQRC